MLEISYIKIACYQVSNKYLVKVIPPISLMMMGALGSLFLIDKEFIMIELMLSLNSILLGLVWGVHMHLSNMLNNIY